MKTEDREKSDNVEDRRGEGEDFFRDIYRQAVNEVAITGNLFNQTAYDLGITDRGYNKGALGRNAYSASVWRPPASSGPVGGSSQTAFKFAGNSFEYTTSGQPRDPNTGYILEASDPRYEAAVAAAPKGGGTATKSTVLNASSNSGSGGYTAENFRDAIATIESRGSGDYAAIGPRNAKYGLPLGRYQVMEANLPQWSKQALGYTVTNDQFLASPGIQDAVFDHIFGGYVKKYGLEGAAQAWFSGPGGVGKGGKKDVLGTTNSVYGTKFLAALGGGGSGGGGSSSNATTRQTQQALAAAGFSPGPIDGIKGKQTTAAIKAFQQANGLTVDGIVGPQTTAALKAVGGGSVSAPTPANMSAGLAAQRLVTINGVTLPIVPTAKSYASLKTPEPLQLPSLNRNVPLPRARPETYPGQQEFKKAAAGIGSAASGLNSIFDVVLKTQQSLTQFQTGLKKADSVGAMPGFNEIARLTAQKGARAGSFGNDIALGRKEQQSHRRTWFDEVTGEPTKAGADAFNNITVGGGRAAPLAPNPMVRPGATGMTRAGYVYENGQQVGRVDTGLTPAQQYAQANQAAQQSNFNSGGGSPLWSTEGNYGGSSGYSGSGGGGSGGSLV